MAFMAEGSFEIADWSRVEAWSQRLKAMPGFALPYDLIPKNDPEIGIFRTPCDGLCSPADDHPRSPMGGNPSFPICPACDAHALKAVIHCYRRP